MRRTAWSAICVWVLLGTAARARGNGKMYPLARLPVAPKIPTQRALVVWRDGVETLVVESAAETASPEVGWVLPLPSEPTTLEVADAGMLTSMTACQRPEIVGPRPWIWQVPCLLCLLVLPATLATISIPDAVQRRKTRTRVFVLCLCLCTLLAFAWFMPTLGHSPVDMLPDDSGVPGVSISSTQRVDGSPAIRWVPSTRWRCSTGDRTVSISSTRTAMQPSIGSRWCLRADPPTFRGWCSVFSLSAASGSRSVEVEGCRIGPPGTR